MYCGAYPRIPVSIPGLTFLGRIIVWKELNGPGDSFPYDRPNILIGFVEASIFLNQAMDLILGEGEEG